MNTVVKVDNLSKRYLLGHKQESYQTLREVMSAGAIRVGKRLMHPFRTSSGQPLLGNDNVEEFWALDDVSFDIKQGDRVGIIGRNGAGKSTLLKVLSRITEPTCGKVSIKGRVASLLEVGTGFHPELTGRENIFLNGAILGMSKVDIKLKFDEIVDFAEVEKFLDTPVKRYSSGMYVRLAFAIAAHLEPEILIVDEVLAVGDAQFQAKCLGKMEDVGKEGRTVLFVSHNMALIKQLCTKAIMLVKGQVYSSGSTSEICSLYSNLLQSEGSLELSDKAISEISNDDVFKLLDVKFSQDGEEVLSNAENGKPLEINVSYALKEDTDGFRVFFDICDMYGTLLFRTFHDEIGSGIRNMKKGVYTSKLIVPEGVFGPTMYSFYLKSGIYNNRYTLPEEGIRFAVNFSQTSKYNESYPGDKFAGCLGLCLPWEVKFEKEFNKA